MSKAQMRLLKEAEDRRLMQAMLAAAVESSSEEEEVRPTFPTPVASVAPKKKKKKKPKKKKPVVDVVVVAEAVAKGEKKELCDDNAKKCDEETKGAADAPVVVAAVPGPNKQKNKTKKNKAPQKSEKQMRDENFDKLLSEFGAPVEAGSGKEARDVFVPVVKGRDVLAVDVCKLDYRVDLKNMFGAAVAKSLTKQKRGGARTLIARGEVL
jgi:hypothetical protein